MPILHGIVSGAQFMAEMATMPEVAFEATLRGIESTRLRRLDDGRTLRGVT